MYPVPTGVIMLRIHSFVYALEQLFDARPWVKIIVQIIKNDSKSKILNPIVNEKKSIAVTRINVIMMSGVNR